MIQDFQHALSSLENARFITYFNMIAYAMLLYDYLLTLGSEIDLVWSAPWSLTKLMFFLTRYFAFIDGAILLYHHMAPPTTSAQTCKILFELSGWLIVWGMLIAELIITFRTWAIWGKSRRMAGFLFLLLLAMMIPTGLFAYHGLNGIKFGPSPIPRLTGCWVIKNPKESLIVDYSIIAVFETVILCLTMYKGIGHLRCRSSSLVRTLYRDGALYYIYFIGFSILNILIILAGPKPGPSLILMQRVLHSICTGRILLNLREAANQDRTRKVLSNTGSISEELNATYQPRTLSSVVNGMDTWDYEIDTTHCMRTTAMDQV